MVTNCQKKKKNRIKYILNILLYRFCLKYTAGFLTKLVFVPSLAMFHIQGTSNSLQLISSECGFSFFLYSHHGFLCKTKLCHIISVKHRHNIYIHTRIHT